MRHPKRNRKDPHLKLLLGFLTAPLICFIVYQVLSILPPQGKDKDISTIAIEENDISIVDKTQPKEIIIPIKEINKETKDSVRIPLLAAEDKNKNAENSQTTRPSNVHSQDNEDPAYIIGRFQELLSEGKLISARELINDYISEKIAFIEDPAIIELAIDIARKTLFTDRIYPEDPLVEEYKIRKGDTLINIAKLYKIPYMLICRINNIDNPHRIRVGMRLKLLKGPFHLKVVMHRLTGYVYLQDTLVEKFPVGLGMDNKTPEGTWLVVDKVKNPVYCDPDTGITYGPNDPDNPTGGFWIRLEGIEGAAIGKQGFGIHGTNEPESIGRFMSKGCIRLKNEDMARLFDMLYIRASKVYTLP